MRKNSTRNNILYKLYLMLIKMVFDFLAIKDWVYIRASRLVC